MTRILVLSDSHADKASLRYAVEHTRDLSAVLFLGDGLGDYESLLPLRNDICTSAVRGNCDLGYDGYPLYRLEIFDDKLFYITHGHREYVKYGLQELTQKAVENGVDVALYGHTHTPFVRHENGLWIMNPGSVRQNSCGVVDLLPSGEIYCTTRPIFSE